MMGKGSKIVIIILSIICVLLIALAAKSMVDVNSWTAKAKDFEDKLDQTLISKQKVQSELDDTKKSKVELEQRLNSMVAQAQSLAKELADEKRSKSALSEEIARKDSQIEAVKSQMENIKLEKDTVAQMLSKSEADFKKLQDELTQIRQAKVALEKKVKELISKEKVELGKITVKKNESGSQDGKVLVVTKEFNFVVINKGVKDGIAAGIEFSVYRQDALIAKIKVEKLYENMAAANITYMSDGKTIQEGDTLRQS